MLGVLPCYWLPYSQPSKLPFLKNRPRRLAARKSGLWRDVGGIPPSRPKDPVFVAAKLEPATERNKRAATKEKKK
jgi:hypothetical protein